MKPPKSLPALLLAALLGALVFGGVSQRSASYARAEAKRLAVVVDSLLTVKAKRDTLYTRDTLRLRPKITKYDTTRVTDTLVRDSIVYIPRAVADDAIQACLAVVRTCEERIADRDALAATRERQWAAERAVLNARIPSLREKLTRAGLVFGAGYLTAKLAP